MTENLEKKTEGSKKIIVNPKHNLIIAYTFTMAILLAIYSSGVFTYWNKNNCLIYPNEYINLNRQKTELVKKTDEWNRYIHKMKEPFKSQYADSIRNAPKRINKINQRMYEIKKKCDKEGNKGFYSWVAFFMED